MSQKINPVSNKLGINKLWKFELLNYGKNFKSYTRFVTFHNYIFDYLNHFCIKNNLLIESINLIQKNFEIRIVVFLNNLKSVEEVNLSSCVISKWINMTLKLHIFRNFNFINSSFLINNYTNFLIIKKENSPKKVLLSIYKLLKNQKKLPKIKYTIQGIKILELKGFKIEVSGCFESSRSQMSKIIKCNFGTIPLTKFNGYIDYSRTTLFTKFGSCGLKVWLFYKFK